MIFWRKSLSSSKLQTKLCSIILNVGHWAVDITPALTVLISLLDVVFKTRYLSLPIIELWCMTATVLSMESLTQGNIWKAAEVSWTKKYGNIQMEFGHFYVSHICSTGSRNSCTSMDFQFSPKSPLKNTDDVGLTVWPEIGYTCCVGFLNGWKIKVNFQFDDAMSGRHVVLRKSAGTLLNRS